MENFQAIIDHAKRVGLTPNHKQIQVPKSNTVPYIHWCTHYRFFHGPNRGEIIPDGYGCCFRHWIGLPKRWGMRHPYYAWQEDIINDWYNYDYFYMLKPPKVGATELFLGLALHTALIDPEWIGGQVALVVGTGANEAEKMIGRCKEMLEVRDYQGYGTGTYKYPINEDYNTKKEFSVNTVEFRAHPANNIDSIRSQPNMRVIIVDEGAFFTIVDQARVREAFEHYIGGSSSKIILVSTAGDVPEGFMFDIEREDPCIYKKYLLDYYVGLIVHPESLTSLYNKEMIEQVKKQPTFSRNYLRQWGHGSGNIFNLSDIEKSIQDYNLLSINRPIISIDPAYGSSKFGILVCEKRDGKLYTLKADEYEHLDHQTAIQRVEGLISVYRPSALIVDASQAGIINYFTGKINTVPIAFGKLGLEMTDYAPLVMGDDKIRIHVTHEELSRQLRAVTRNKNGMPDKTRLSFDMGDAFLMACWYFRNDGDYSQKVNYSNKYSNLIEDDE